MLMRWSLPLLLPLLALGAWAAAPKSAEQLAQRLQVISTQLQGLQQKMQRQGTAQRTAEQAMMKASVALMGVGQYPAAFWQMQAVMAGVPGGAGVLRAAAVQQARALEDLRAQNKALVALHDEAVAAQAEWQQVYRALTELEDDATRAQRRALARAGQGTEALAAKLADALGEQKPQLVEIDPLLRRQPPKPAKPLPAPQPELVKKPIERAVSPKPAPAAPRAVVELGENRLRPDEMGGAVPVALTEAVPPQSSENQMAENKKAVSQEDVPAEVSSASTRVRKPPRGLPVAGQLLVGFRKGEGAEAEGVVYRAPVGHSVHAPAAGEVLFAGMFRQFGGVVIIHGAAGQEEVLGGLGQLKAKAGDKVSPGELIGHVGERGRLYWEVRVGNRAVNPVTHKR